MTNIVYLNFKTILYISSGALVVSPFTFSFGQVVYNLGVADSDSFV